MTPTSNMNSRLASVTWTQVSKRRVGEGRKVKGHADQWVKGTCYINVSTWAWSPGPHKSWHAAWTSGLPQSRRQHMGQPCLRSRKTDPATNKVDGDERHMRSSCDLHMYTDTSISMFTRVNGHMCTHVHMCVHAHTALIKIKRWKDLSFCMEWCVQFISTKHNNRKGKQRGFSLSVFLQQ